MNHLIGEVDRQSSVPNASGNGLEDRGAPEEKEEDIRFENVSETLPRKVDEKLSGDTIEKALASYRELPGSDRPILINQSEVNRESEFSSSTGPISLSPSKHIQSSMIHY